MAITGVLSAEEKSVVDIRIPEELRLSPAPEVPDDRNALVLLSKQITEDVLPDSRSWMKALAEVKAGRPLQDRQLLDRAELMHGKANVLLQSPARFPVNPKASEWMMPLLRVMQAEELLARQASLQGDRTKMEKHVESLLAWNRHLREARPNLVGWATAWMGWPVAFNILLSDWEKHPDQAARLREIEELFLKSRVRQEELIQLAKCEYESMLAFGGCRDFLREWRKIGECHPMLKKPFDQVPIDELLTFSYDEKASEELGLKDAQQRLADVCSGKPLMVWESISRKFPQRTLEDYRRMPNGLHFLLAEQTDPSSSIYVWGMTQVLAAQMETCFAWLRAEREGKAFNADDPSIAKDPMEGKPLRVDEKQRLIFSIGSDFRPEKSEEIPAGIGFHRALPDPAFRVPKWR